MGIDLSGGHAAMDYDEHARTYLRFILFIKVSVVFMVILLGGLAYFLV
ncbi:MAG: aa3-type cytochrome c oxidase subunit IV [Hyphomicrobium sp.]